MSRTDDWQKHDDQSMTVEGWLHEAKPKASHDGSVTTSAKEGKRNFH